CQILTLVVGAGVTLLLLRQRREGLGLARMPGWSAVVSTVLAVPVVFVAASYVAIQIALPTLLEELRTRGAHASQQNAGEFGRALTQAPLFITLLWGPLLAGVGEELLFRASCGRRSRTSRTACSGGAIRTASGFASGSRSRASEPRCSRPRCSAS